jgi:pyruvate kinase
MKIKKKTVVNVIEKLDVILDQMNQDELKSKDILDNVHPYYQKSAQNLLHYMSFRKFDVRSIQEKLKDLGLTRFSNAGGHIKASVLMIRYLLSLVVTNNEREVLKKHWSIKKGKKILKRNTIDLLGQNPDKRRVRIMVTQPSIAANDYDMVKRMVENGMDCARINCAHDAPDVWLKIINHVKQAAAECERDVKIAMDLAGPKIRTGKLVPGPKVSRFKPKKDVFGKVIEPSRILLVSNSKYTGASNQLPLNTEDLSKFQEGDIIDLMDARAKRRHIVITKCEGDHIEAEVWKTMYVSSDTRLQLQSGAGEEYEVGDIPEIESYVLLKEADEIWVYKNEILGSNAAYDAQGTLIHPAMISCQMPQVFEYIKKGDRVFFDDGKIGGFITEVNEEVFKVKITLAKENGSKLKAFKGINFPDSKLGFSGLTPKDKADLPFITEHADIVNFSFVNRREDVTELYEELSKLDALGKTSVVLKIETQFGFENLVSILLEAMKSENIGVMIARGDLAIETGWEHIGHIQQEMLAVCEAAHVPVIWATQVLEHLAKSGLPSRSEITDATMALKAECVMLNKGPYINNAISLLNTILCTMESSQHKNEAMLPKLTSQKM